jgi:hypothetical protein
VSDPFDGPDEYADDDAPPAQRSMLPLDRRRLRSGHPPQAIPIQKVDREPDDWPDESEERTPRSTRQDLDPVFGYILAMALSIGLTPVQANMRLVLLWTFIALMGGMAFLLGSGIRIKVTDPGDLVWGLVFGVLTGGALLLVGTDTLNVAAERVFGAGQEDDELLNTWVFQATVFVMPLSETLFFRGAMQRVHGIPVVALLSSAWSMLLFFPELDLADTPMVGMVIGTALVLLNFLYSYVNARNGLAASFFCQVIAGSLLLLVPLFIA